MAKATIDNLKSKLKTKTTSEVSKPTHYIDMESHTEIGKDLKRKLKKYNVELEVLQEERMTGTFFSPAEVRLKGSEENIMKILKDPKDGWDMDLDDYNEQKESGNGIKLISSIKTKSVKTKDKIKNKIKTEKTKSDKTSYKKDFIEWKNIYGKKVNGWEASDNNGISIIWENEDSEYFFFASPGWENEKKLQIQIVGDDGDFEIGMYSKNLNASYDLKEYLKEVKNIVDIIKSKKTVSESDFKDKFSGVKKLYENGGMMAKGGELKSKYKDGDMVYSYQNQDYAAPVNYVKFVPWNSNLGSHPNDKFVYRLTLKDGNSHWINEDSLYKTKQDKYYAKGGELKSKEEVEKILQELGIRNYTINDDLTVDVNGNVVIRGKNLKNIPVNFNKIIGRFDCSNNQLTSLKGSPKEVNGYFYCNYNELTSLEGGPKVVNSVYYCNNNKLTSLKGAPKEVNGYFDCRYNELTSLEGSPEIMNDNFDCDYNKLTSLKGAPKEVNGRFNCSHNKLTTLEGGPKIVNGTFYCNYNELTSLKGAPKSEEIEYLKGNKIKESIKEVENIDKNLRNKSVESYLFHQPAQFNFSDPEKPYLEIFFKDYVEQKEINFLARNVNDGLADDIDNVIKEYGYRTNRNVKHDKFTGGIELYIEKIEDNKIAKGGYMANGGKTYSEKDYFKLTQFADKVSEEIIEHFKDSEYGFPEDEYYPPEVFEHLYDYGINNEMEVDDIIKTFDWREFLTENKKDIASLHLMIPKNKMAKGGEVNEQEMIEKLKKQFKGKDLWEDEIMDEYEVKMFDWEEYDDEEVFNKWKRSKEKKNYIVPFESDDDSYIFILVPKNKMANGGEVSEDEMIEKLKKQFKGKDLWEDEIMDEYEVKMFDWEEYDDEEVFNKWKRSKEKKNYIVPFESDDDSYIFILVPKNKMANGGEIKDQYQGKSPGYLWNNWNEKQRKHFVHDHKLIATDDYRINSSFDELPAFMKKEINEHYMMGQYADGGYMAHGGSIEEQNNEMLQSNMKEIKHHVDELKNIVSNNTEVEPWVIAKTERASTDLSDVTHYLDGRTEHEVESDTYFANGGIVEHGLKIGDLIKRQEGDYIIVENGGNEYIVHLNSGYRNKYYLKDGGYMADGGRIDGEIYQRIDGLVTIDTKKQLTNDAKSLRSELLEEGFENDEIDEYLCHVVTNAYSKGSYMADGGQIVRLKKDLPYMASLSNLYNKDLKVDDITETYFASGTKKFYHITHDGDKYEVNEDFIDDKFKMAKGGMTTKDKQIADHIIKTYNMDEPGMAPVYANQLRREEARLNKTYGSNWQKTMTPADKVNKFLNAVRVADNTIQLKDIKVEASPRGNWVVYEHGKVIMTVNNDMLDEETIRTYNLEHHN